MSIRWRARPVADPHDHLERLASQRALHQFHRLHRGGEPAPLVAIAASAASTACSKFRFLLGASDGEGLFSLGD
jgi:hypothetical protein